MAVEAVHSPKVTHRMSMHCILMLLLTSASVRATTPFMGHDADILSPHHWNAVAFAFVPQQQQSQWHQLRLCRNYNCWRWRSSKSTGTRTTANNCFELSTTSLFSSSSSSPPRRRRIGNNNSSSNTGGNGHNGDRSNSSGSRRSSRSSRSSSSSSTAGGTVSSNRNRGANAANHNRRGHSFRTSSKDGAMAMNNSGRRASSVNTKRPPRWEREGDRLYAEVTKDLNQVLLLSNDGDEKNTGKDDDVHSSSGMMEPIISAKDVCRLLQPWTASAPLHDDEYGSFMNEIIQPTAQCQQIIQSEMDITIDTIATPRENGENEIYDSVIATSSPPPTQQPPPFLWGTLPVGPVLSSRLYATGRSEPTSVQRAAFPILTATVSDNISHSSYSHNNNNHNYQKNKMRQPLRKKTIKRTNAIIASPTGTGKTLAYLLPLLCTSPGGQRGEGTGGILIVTPTIELACQIQREVDILWPPLSFIQSSPLPTSSLFVVGDGSSISSSDSHDGEDYVDEFDNSGNDQDDRVSLPQGRLILRSLIRNHSSPIIAGTPKMLRMLYREAGKIANGDYDNTSISDEERATSIALCTNLRAIVLDEADRLLRTEAAAREAMERKNRKIAQQRSLLQLSNNEASEENPNEDANDEEGRIQLLLPTKKRSKLVIARQTQAEFLLRDLPIRSLDDVQIVCASATVGRTMRRQLMQILDKPSADAAATLVTGEEDVRVKSKDVERRRAALLPGRLHHAYRVVSVDGESDEMITEGQEKESASGNDNYMNERTASTSKLTIMTVAERNEEHRIKQTVSTLRDTMMSDLIHAKPILIFPGRIGVERIQTELEALGLQDIRTLRNLDGMQKNSTAAENTNGPDIGSSRRDSIGYYGGDSNPMKEKWKSVPVFIIGERFARGLDLPNVEYVFILTPPSSAAGYTHMAGRTGRCGKMGVAITFVRPKNNEASRLASIAEALGLRFDPRLSGMLLSKTRSHHEISNKI